MESGRQNHSEGAHVLQQIETEYKRLLHRDLQAIVGNDAIRLIAERLEFIAN